MQALKRLLAWAGLIDGDTPPPTEKALAENFKAFFETTYGTPEAAAPTDAGADAGEAGGTGNGNSDGTVETAAARRGVRRCPNFEALSYLSALEKAKAEMKMLFVYLHAPHHFNSQVRDHE